MSLAADGGWKARPRCSKRDGQPAVRQWRAPARRLSGQAPAYRARQAARRSWRRRSACSTRGFTPNDAFFVRYHLADIPPKIDPEAFRLNIQGKVDTPLSLSVAELKSGFEPVELAAVNQCSGNSRGFFEPRVAGGQLANGAMGNARWKGVPLKALLGKAGVQAGAVQVSFQGLDRPVLPETPTFIKALDLDHALDGEVMIAYAMNGEDLPWLNGFPIRLVVPGCYGTYWVKHLNEITVLDARSTVSG